MKELQFMKSTPKGVVKGVLRVINKDLFFKHNESDYSRQAIEQFKKKGIKVVYGTGWIKVDLIGDNEAIKLGNFEIDITEDKNYEIEYKIFNFFKEQYYKLGFAVKETQQDG